MVEVKAKLLQAGIYTLVFICLVLNLFQTYQIDRGILKTDRMTKAYYFSVFGQTSPPTQKQLSLLSIDRSIEGFQFEDLLPLYQKKKTFIHNFRSDFRLTKDTIYTPVIEYSIEDMSNKPYFLMKLTWTYKGNSSTLIGKIFSATAMYKGESYAWLGADISNNLLLHDSTKKEISMYYLTPHFRTYEDRIRIGAWNQQGDTISLSKIVIEILEPKVVNE